MGPAFNRKYYFAWLAGILFSGLSFGAVAEDITGDASGVYANTGDGFSVAGPGGFHKEEKDSTYIEGPFPDGTYRYEIFGTVSSALDPYDSKLVMNNGRDMGSMRGRDGLERTRGEDVIASGHFTMENGVILQPGYAEEEE